MIASGSAVQVKRLGLLLVSARYRLITSETETAKLPHKGRFRWFQRVFHFWFDMASPRFQSSRIMISSSFAGLRLVWFRKPAIECMRRIAQACWIGYFAKISSARLKALSIACSGAMPLFMTSNMATLNRCSAFTWAIAGL